MVTESRSVLRVRLVVLALLTTVFAYGIYASLGFRANSRPMPLFIATSGIILAVVALASNGLTAWRTRGQDVVSDTTTSGVMPDELIQGFTTDDDHSEDEITDPFSSGELLVSAKYFGWFVGYIILVVVVGVHIATFLFVTAFLTFRNGSSPLRAGWSAAITVGVLLALERFYSINLPQPFWV